MPTDINATTSDLPAVQPFLLLKSASAGKLGQRAQGKIHYQILTDLAHQALYLRLTKNDSGGCFSQELVDFKKVRSAVAGQPADQPFPARLFRNVFVGRSINNSGFMACILRAEGLLTGVTGKTHLHALAGDWSAWDQACLELPGDPLEIPVKPGTLDLTPVLPADTTEPSPKVRPKGKRKAAASNGDDNARAP